MSGIKFVNRRDSGAVKTVYREDVGELKEPKRTKEGYLFVEARIARSGIYIYHDAEGNEVRELITRDVLNDPESLDTLKSKPATLEHPDDNVDSENWNDLAVGDVGSDYRIDEDGTPIFPVYIKSKKAVEAVDAGTHREVSPGYMAVVDYTPGVHPEFGAYDAKQIKRSPYNHLAIVPAARGGSNVRLRADAARMVRRCDDNPNPKKGKPMTLEDAIKAGIVVLKADHEKVVADLEAAKNDSAEKDNQIATLTGERDALQGKVDAIPSDEDAAKTRLDWFADRREIVDAAEKVGIADDVIVKTDNADLKKLIVAKARPKAKTDAAPAYYDAMFDVLKNDLTGDNNRGGYEVFNLEDTDVDDNNGGGGNHRRDRRDSKNGKIPNPGAAMWNNIDKAAGRA